MMEDRTRQLETVRTTAERAKRDLGEFVFDATRTYVPEETQQRRRDVATGFVAGVGIGIPLGGAIVVTLRHWLGRRAQELPEEDAEEARPPLEVPIHEPVDYEEIVAGTIPKVKARIEDADVDLEKVIAAERAGKDRVTLLTWLEELASDERTPDDEA